jgi:hypothetical protein
MDHIQILILDPGMRPEEILRHTNRRIHSLMASGRMTASRDRKRLVLKLRLYLGANPRSFRFGGEKEAAGAAGADRSAIFDLKCKRARCRARNRIRDGTVLTAAGKALKVNQRCRCDGGN